MGEGLRGSNDSCSTLHRSSIFHSATHNQTGPLWFWFLSGWACAHSRPLWVSPTTSPVRLGVSPAASSAPSGVFNQRFEALFPLRWRPGLCGLLRFPTVPPSLSMRECGAEGSAIGCTACPVHLTIHQSLGAAALQRVLSAPAACLHPSYRSGQMFLLYLLGCRTSCGSIFCQFWLFFVLNCCPFGCARRRSVSTYAPILVF